MTISADQVKLIISKINSNFKSYYIVFFLLVCVDSRYGMLYSSSVFIILLYCVYESFLQRNSQPQWRDMYLKRHWSKNKTDLTDFQIHTMLDLRFRMTYGENPCLWLLCVHWKTVFLSGIMKRFIPGQSQSWHFTYSQSHIGTGPQYCHLWGLNTEVTACD